MERRPGMGVDAEGRAIAAAVRAAAAADALLVGELEGTKHSAAGNTRRKASKRTTRRGMALALLGAMLVLLDGVRLYQYANACFNWLFSCWPIGYCNLRHRLVLC